MSIRSAGEDSEAFGTSIGMASAGAGVADPPPLLREVDGARGVDVVGLGFIWDVIVGFFGMALILNNTALLIKNYTT